MSVQAIITMPADTMNIAGITVSRFSGFDSIASDGDKEIIKWLWDFGDGTTALGPETYHVYRTPGTKTIKLSVLGDSFGQHSITVTVVVKSFSGKGYFVSSSTGNDKFPGTNALPFKTIERAMDAAAAGRVNNPDVICLKRGDTWNQTGDLFPNRPSIWIAYGEGANPVINMLEGKIIYFLNGFHEEPANTYGYSVYFNDILVKWPTGNPAHNIAAGTWGSQISNVKLQGGAVAAAGGPQKIILKNTEITGVDYSGFFSSSSWCAVINCNIHACGNSPTFHHEIYMSMNSNVLVKNTKLDGRGAKGANYSLTFSGTRKFYVADCELMHTNYGINLGTNGDDDQRQGQDGLIERCVIHDMGEFDQSGAFWFTFMTRCIIKNCLIFNCDKFNGQAVFIFSDRKATDFTSDIRIFNNTIYSDDTQEFQMGPWVQRIAFKNNIIHKDKANLFMSVDDAIDLSQLDFDYNVYYNTIFGPDDDRAFYVKGKQSFNSWKSKFQKDLHSVFGDPKFIDAPNKNFHLAEGSAAKNMALSIANVWEDFERADRYQNLVYDAGAYLA